jgi:hypothetical protein
MTSMHDLRLQLRDKSKQIDELELKLKELKTEIEKKDSIIHKLENDLKERDDTINQLMAKEKDLILNVSESITSNSISSTVSQQSPQQKISCLQNQSLITKRVDSPVLLSVNAIKSKRVAISAEPAQVYKKSRDFSTYLKEHDKSIE